MPIPLLFKYRSLIIFNQMLTNHSELKQSLTINHQKSTRVNQDALKLCEIKTEKSRRSLAYFLAQLYNRYSLIVMPRLSKNAWWLVCELKTGLQSAVLGCGSSSSGPGAPLDSVPNYPADLLCFSTSFESY